MYKQKNMLSHWATTIARQRKEEEKETHVLIAIIKENTATQTCMCMYREKKGLTNKEGGNKEQL